MGMKKMRTAEGKHTKEKLTPEQLMLEIETAIQDIKRVEQGELKPRQAEELLRQGLGT